MQEIIQIIIQFLKQIPPINFLLYFGVSAVPTFIWLLICLYFDRQNPEPKKHILRIFGWGCFVVLPILLISGPLNIIISRAGWSNLLTIFILSFLVDGPIEEGAKYFIFLTKIYHHPVFNEARDGIIYGITVGLGMSFLENILYALTMVNLVGGISIIFLRGLTSTLMHFLSGGILGYFFGLAKFLNISQKRKNFLMVQGLFIAILFHGLYNSIVRFSANWCLIPLSFLLVITYLSILRALRQLSQLH